MHCTRHMHYCAYHACALSIFIQDSMCTRTECMRQPQNVYVHFPTCNCAICTAARTVFFMATALSTTDRQALPLLISANKIDVCASAWEYRCACGLRRECIDAVGLRYICTYMPLWHAPFSHSSLLYFMRVASD